MSTKNSVAVILHDIGDMLNAEHNQEDIQESLVNQFTQVDQRKSPEVCIPKQSQQQTSGEPSKKDEKMQGPENWRTSDFRQHTQNGIQDHAYADEGRILRKKRKSTQADASITCCTICGVTVRPSELQSHYDWEVDKLNKMLRPDGSRYREPKYEKDRKKSSIAKRKKDPASDDTDDIVLDAEERKKEFRKAKDNRQERLYSRLRKHRRASLSDNNEEPATSSSGDPNSTRCPICQIVLTGSAEERNSHAEACLVARSSSGATEEDEDVDIEGNGFEEYTWCGQTRVRVTSMLETGFRGLGYEVSNRQSSDVETELNIDSDDDSAEFGPPQYGEADIIQCASEDIDERTQALRNAVLEGYQERVPPLHQENPTVESSCDANANEQNCEQPSATSSLSGVKPSYQSNPLYPSQSRTVIESLKAKIEELEDMVCKQNTLRCLICMDSYRNATVSIQCWHVHCEECWLRTLGAKKLCPQCNMITSPNQLRRIYL